MRDVSMGTPRFRANSIEHLQRILKATRPQHPGYPDRKAIHGWHGDRLVVEFWGENFHIAEGEGKVGTGIFETKHLWCNEGYEEFLLGLEWTSAHGWKSSLHMLALEAE